MIFPKRFRIYPLILTLALVPLSAVSANDATTQATQAATATAPNTLPLDGLPNLWLQGDPITEWEKDKVYIFEFWATWCGPCVAAMPHMEDLHHGILKEKLNAQIIGVNVSDRTPPERLKKFLAKQSVPPTYTIAVDTAKTAEQHWLRAQKVIGIPYAFALKNGKIIWRGHPQSLSGELISQMTHPDFVAPQARTPKTDEEAPEVRRRAREIAHLFSDGKVVEAETQLKAFLEDSAIADAPKIRVLQAPCDTALRNREYRKMNAYLRRKAETFPKNFFNRFETAYFILGTNDVPADERDLALAEECLNAALSLADNTDAKSRLPAIYAMLATVYAEREEKESEINARKLAWEHSRECQTQQRIREKITTPEAENLYTALENGTAVIPEEFFTRSKEKKSLSENADAQISHEAQAEQIQVINSTLTSVSRQIADKNYDLAGANIERIRPLLDAHPMADMRASEMLASIEYLNGNYKNVGEICTALMNKYPNTEIIADRQARIINSNREMRAANLPVLILAARNIIGAGTTNPSAYWEIIANLYAEMGDIRNAIYASFCARETSEYWQSYQNAQ